MRNTFLIAVFMLSGAAGLAYESLWAQYLGLLLGHAATAQSFVLFVFMGGLAVGAHLAGQRIHALRRPLVAYAFVEAGIGVGAWLFHPAFTVVQSFVLE